MTMVNAYAPGAGNLSPQDQARITRRTRLLGPAYRLFYETPVHFVRGQGVWLYDAAGQAYLDCYNNVASLGHCHPHVSAATARQSALYASHTRYLHDTVLDYAEMLLATFPPELSHVMFTCTGSEANDLALRIAFAHTGGTGVIVTENAYHGVTQATSALSPSLGPGVNLGPHIRTVPAPDDPAAFATDVAQAAADLRRHGIQPAALLVDTIFSSDGVHTAPCLAPAAAAIRAAGGLFIADEVQPGFGRTGEAFWGFQRHGVIPDMVSMGKPMGNGYPVAGLVMQPRIIEAFGTKARYFNTFGGNAVAAATAMAVLEVLQAENLQSNAATVGTLFRDGLLNLAQKYDSLGPLRSAGLFLGQDIVTDNKPDPQKAVKLVNHLRENRILISATGALGHTLKIRPPLIFTAANLDQFLQGLETALFTMT